jgi:hypothetical protein
VQEVGLWCAPCNTYQGGAVQALNQDDLTQDIYAEMPLNSSRCAVQREREPTRSQRASSFAM